MPKAVDISKRKERRKKNLKQAKSYWGRGHSNYKTAKEAITKGLFAYHDKREQKIACRKLWVARINAACREEGLSYTRFIVGLEKAGITINRKALAHMATEDSQFFKAIVAKAKAALEIQTTKRANRRLGKNNTLHQADTKQGIPLPLSANNQLSIGESVYKISSVFKDAVKQSIVKKQKQGLPVARYDTETGRAYLENIDGLREYI